MKSVWHKKNYLCIEIHLQHWYLLVTSNCLQVVVYADANFVTVLSCAPFH